MKQLCLLCAKLFPADPAGTPSAESLSVGVCPACRVRCEIGRLVEAMEPDQCLYVLGHGARGNERNQTRRHRRAQGRSKGEEEWLRR